MMAYLKRFDRVSDDTLTVTQQVPYGFWHEGPPYQTLTECEAQRLRWRRIARESRDPELRRRRILTDPYDDVSRDIPLDDAAEKDIFAYDIPMTTVSYARCVAVR
jgi:hypothetical protein